MIEENDANLKERSGKFWDPLSFWISIRQTYVKVSTNREDKGPGEGAGWSHNLSFNICFPLPNQSLWVCVCARVCAQLEQ